MVASEAYSSQLWQTKCKPQAISESNCHLEANNQDSPETKPVMTLLIFTGL